MKKYMLFCFATYYPGGGMSDYVGSWDTLPEAITEAQKRRDDYREIYDRDTLGKVWYA